MVKITFIIISPLVQLHMWLESRQNDKVIQGSDLFLALDARLPDGGLYLQESAGIFAVEPVFQIIENNEIFEFTVNFSTNIPFQKYIKMICRVYKLASMDCAKLFGFVLHVAYQKLLITSVTFPSVQIMPTPSNPFVFLHIEKTGGTTMRE
jgi:hypothetical protein